MSKLPVMRAAKLIPILLRLGFQIMRQRGSHVHLAHLVDKKRKVTVPMHNKDLPKKTLLSILQQAQISLQDFLRLMWRK